MYEDIELLEGAGSNTVLLSPVTSKVLHYISLQTSFSANSSGECYQACRTDANCSASSFSPDKKCKLFNFISKSTIKPGALTEVKNCSSNTDMILGNYYNHQERKFQILFQTPAIHQTQL